MPLSRRDFLGLVALAGAGAACGRGGGGFVEVGAGATFNDVLAGRPQKLTLIVPPYEILPGAEQFLSVAVHTNPGSEPVKGAGGKLWFSKARETEAIGPFELRALEDGFNERGLYGATATFPEDGIWVALAEIEREPGLVEVGLAANVGVGKQEANTMPRPGERAIAVPTPTTSNARGVDPICTLLPSPCSMHAISLDRALDNAKPTVLIIGTPRFCQSQFCGPEVEIIDALAAETSGVDFVHMEVLKNDDQANVQAYYGQPPDGYRGTPLAPAAISWNLYEEPVIYFIDAGGVVKTRLLGAIDGVAARAALEALVA